MKKTIQKTVEDTYAAAAFAEAGEHETAMKMAGIQSIAHKVSETVRHLFDTHMTAASFAEAGCFDTANEIMGTRPSAAHSSQKQSLDTFLQSVGLQHAKVRYGLVRV